ncbi:uncharacterized protein LOC131635417 [Vicia villosa]|uniref:uncharacterized protein LOC131635417 n=1 Tax=Vicia villosa TaxID=3911 RepID=UPI00273B166A|nr:uncharacterized protein LOC131635417 [Vicia villosa]
MVAEKSKDVNVEALTRVVGAIGQAPHVNAGIGGGDELRAFGDFRKINPPIFEGGYGPDKARAWMKEMERIFQVLNCTDVQKVRFSTHMLMKGAENWWSNTRQRFDEEGTEITWALFRRVFLGNYFPEDVRGKKGVRFLELKREEGRYRGKPYDGWKEQKSGSGKKTSGGDTPAKVVCFKCGQAGHKSNVCNAKLKRCFCCGKTGHVMSDCRPKEMVCFNCGDEGHISGQCQRPKKTQASGKVFPLVESQMDNKDERIEGKVSLVVLLYNN